jgi:hypothetical protein
MPTFREAARAMAVTDATMVRHLDALLRDFVDDNRALFGFWGDLSTESALSEAGWAYFRDSYLAVRGDGPLLRLELVGDPCGRQLARRSNQKWWRTFEALQTAGAVDSFFDAMGD